MLTQENRVPLLQMLNGDTVRLSRSDKKLAAIVRSDAANVIHLSIASLADKADVSEPTVNRFCHKLGCDGYPQFKLRLAQEISATGHMFAENLAADDDSTSVINKILSSVRASVQSLATTIDANVLETVTKELVDCETINFFGMGASGFVALDAQHKFFRFGMPVSAQTDFITQRMMCSMMDKSHVAVFISYTGRTEAMVHNASLARESGAVVIGITMSGSPLARHCDHVLNTITAEDTDLFTPMNSRIMHLAVVDMLATNVALKMGNDVEKNIRAIKTSLASTRTDNR